MAEGFARHYGLDAHSAGLFPSRVHPRAIEAMEEVGIDISGQASKGIDEGLLNNMDIVITLCGNAEAACPATVAKVKRLHWPIEDPIGVSGTEEEVMAAFRRARDEIKKRVIGLMKKYA
jgi:arsenate reductase